MASVFKRGRWVDATGSKCRKGTPGATWQESRYYTVQVFIDGRPKLVKGYTDKQASEQLGAKLERAKAQGEQGLVDPFKAHRSRPLSEHIADWIAELRQLGRDDAYIRPCQARMERLMKECNWSKLSDINAAAFIRWRATATATIGHGKGRHVEPMSARTLNHYYETLRAFCRWCVKPAKRMAGNPVADVAKVETVGKLKRERRALAEQELAALLGVVHGRHQLAYRMILATGLRRAELRQLVWGDIHLEAPRPFIQLRAETTKAGRGDILPIRADLARLLQEARGNASDGGRVCRSIPSMDTHKRYLRKAGIAYEDEQGRRADFHSLRHTFGTLLSKSGVAPRVAMSLMRHSDIKLTMKTYTDPRIFDLAGAIESLPSLPSGGTEVQTARATGTDGVLSTNAGRSESVSSPSAELGQCAAVIGELGDTADVTVSADVGGNRQQKSPSGEDGQKERAMGLEPKPFTLATPPNFRNALFSGEIQHILYLRQPW